MKKTTKSFGTIKQIVPRNADKWFAECLTGDGDTEFFRPLVAWVKTDQDKIHGLMIGREGTPEIAEKFIAFVSYVHEKELPNGAIFSIPKSAA